jgi:arsenic resistance protein ArsH
MGAETHIYDPRGLPQPDDAPASHPKVTELRELSIWSEGHLWCSPERHGAMTGIFKSQIDWLPLETGGVRPTQGRTLAVCQGQRGLAIVQHGQSASHLGPLDAHDYNPESVISSEGYDEFDDAGRMKPSEYYARLVDLMEELCKFTLLTRDRSEYLVDRYSERKAEGRRPAAKALINAGAE